MNAKTPKRQEEIQAGTSASLATWRLGVLAFISSFL
jgi:hypothetical protein